ncbi:BLUF domain-containing protein [Klebsiella pneumoniae]|uniref:BLUF domain-containing protein n=1 Tax=Klebsiella pneumoniae TaxID=573 RepID=UPI003D3647E7
MLTTIIYRSHAHSSISRTSIMEMIELANAHNIKSDVTGILIFNGIHFLQLLGKVRISRSFLPKLTR